MVTRIVAQRVARQASGAARQSKARRTVGRAAAVAPFSERMSKVDTAWLRMDSPGNLMMIVGFWVLKPGIRYEELCARAEERMLKYDRFRQRVEQDATGATWIDDADFDIRHHVVRERLPSHPRGQAHVALQQRLGELAMQQLDHRHPLWEFRLIEDYDGGSAMMVRIHHCIADGVALVAVTMALVDGGEAAPRSSRSARADEHWLSDALIKPFAGLAMKALNSAGDGSAKSLVALLDPRRGIPGSVELAKLGLRLTTDAAALLLMSDDSPTRLKGKLAMVKRVAWCEPLPFDEVKAIAKALSCSINDVLLSCVAGSIGAYLRSAGDDITGKEIRVMIPVNLRPVDEEPHRLGNRFGLAPMVLPISIGNPVERVYEVRRRMGALKGSTQPLLAFCVLAVAGLLIKPGQDVLLDLFRRKTSAIMTNVPGPRQKLRLLGSTLEQAMFWVPQSGEIGLGVSVLSYGGGVQFGVMSDTAVCPEPRKITELFESEFGRLTVLALMLPWDE